MVGSWVVSCLLTAGHEHLDRDKWLPARHLTVVAIVGISGLEDKNRHALDVQWRL